MRWRDGKYEPNTLTILCAACFYQQLIQTPAGFLNTRIICFLYITANWNVGYLAVGLDLLLGFLELRQFLKMFSVLKSNSIKNEYMWLPVKA